MIEVQKIVAWLQQKTALVERALQASIEVQKFSGHVHLCPVSHGQPPPQVQVMVLDSPFGPSCVSHQVVSPPSNPISPGHPVQVAPENFCNGPLHICEPWFTLMHISTFDNDPHPPMFSNIILHSFSFLSAQFIT